MLVKKLLDRGMIERLSINYHIMKPLPVEISVPNRNCGHLENRVSAGEDRLTSLFLFFIKEMAGDFRVAQGKPRNPEEKSLKDQRKLAADEVFPIPHSEI